ncbi:TetR/AcrR family transcriptional regulator [Streptomyces sp. GS7]|uniref:TetR/AcrR family transcriptional regulator n=1 Tax=Streptomyces sp. GS7 TaxID=2692234 RepID=UPI00131733D1|nr:TetR/AcrR family transcriptional regulator [Streptomyces sp. GS7]QHC23948.1 TetR family transcriptional regulator [Streptomyces sp. GS7]
MRPAEPGRRSLLDAGRRLLAGEDLSRLSVNAIVGAAGMAKGSFYQHWPTRTHYLVALHAVFHDELTARVEAAIGGLPPGPDRLAAGIGAYLDGCLTQPATKALLVQARTDAALGPQVAARNDAFAGMAAADLAALGWRPAEPVAALLVAAVADVALHELTAGRPRDDLRTAALRLATRTPGADPGS